MTKIHYPRRDIPSLRALLAFEAAARNKNFTICASELNLTPGAVSRQIMQLESHLQIRLFDRTHHLVCLTPAGETYYKLISPALEMLAEASSVVGVRKREKFICVNALPSFTLRWLIPRLSLFQQQFPDIEVRLDTTREPIDGILDFDVAVRRSDIYPERVEANRLMSEFFLPVCSPAFYEKIHTGNKERLNSIPLIHQTRYPHLWQEWSKVAGVKLVAKSSDFSFDDWFYTINAAISGLGVAVAPSSLVLNEFQQNMLVAPFGDIKVIGHPYCLLTTKNSIRKEGVKTFMNWILDCGKATDGSYMEFIKNISNR